MRVCVYRCYFICFVIQRKAYFLFIAWHTWNIFIHNIVFRKMQIWSKVFNSHRIIRYTFGMIRHSKRYMNVLCFCVCMCMCVHSITQRWNLKLERVRRDKEATNTHTHTQINEKDNIDQRQIEEAKETLLFQTFLLACLLIFSIFLFLSSFPTTQHVYGLRHTHTYSYQRKETRREEQKKRLHVCIHFNSLGNHKLCLC